MMTARRVIFEVCVCVCAVFVVRQTRPVRVRALRGSLTVEITRLIDTSAPAEGRRVGSVAVL